MKQPRRNIEVLVPSEASCVSTQEITIIRQYTDKYTNGKGNKSNLSDAISLLMRFGSPEAAIEASRSLPGFKRRDLKFIEVVTRCRSEIAQEALQQCRDVNMAIAVIYYTEMRHNQRLANALYFSGRNGNGCYHLMDSGSRKRNTGVSIDRSKKSGKQPKGIKDQARTTSIKSGEASGKVINLEKMTRGCEDGESRDDSEMAALGTRDEIVKRVWGAATRRARE